MNEENSTGKITSFPVLPIRDVVIFPHMVAPILISRDATITALDQLLKDELSDVILLAQKNPRQEKPKSSDLYQFGVLSKIIQVLKFPDGNVKVIVEGISRVTIDEIEEQNSTYFAKVSEVSEQIIFDDNAKALIRITVDKFHDYVKKNTRLSPENLFALPNIMNEPGKLADFIATYIEIEGEDRQKVLETIDSNKRLEIVNAILDKEIEILTIEETITKKFKANINKTQKEFYLREKIKVIKEELKEFEDSKTEFEEYRIKLKDLEIPEKYKTKLSKEISRLEEMPNYSTEYSFTKNYIDRVFDLPWNNTTKDNNDIVRAQRILDEDHWGLKDVKDRIIEFLAVRQLTKKKHATVLCFVGPPGVGKTSLAKSIARSLNRKFAYISLGGINDESEIRGHRRTYVGSMPGRIIQAIENAGTRNPVILLDELEKMMRSHMGDPTAALLEVLDPEQNVNYTDHYIDMPFDLSEVFFIATANTVDNIYKALRDRLEVIQLSGYTDDEKLNIARHFLVPKQMEIHGIQKSKLIINDIAINSIISEYTREAGVRNLERSIAKISRKFGTKLVKGELTRATITEKNIDKYLGPAKYTMEDKRLSDEVGIVTGLAWTESGGDILYIETNIMPGKGKLRLTGSLGDVMKESARAALSYIRSKHKDFNLSNDFHNSIDIHMHIPEGATPKDGPSAGLAIALSMLSILMNKKARADIAITGEITLRGKVLPVGGIKEKVLAALRNDIYTIILPEKNKKDIHEIPDYLKEKMNFIYVKTIDEAIEVVLK